MLSGTNLVPWCIYQAVETHAPGCASLALRSLGTPMLPVSLRSTQHGAHTDTRSPRVLIPPKSNAQVKPKAAVLGERNRNIRSRARLGARQWHTQSGYSRRSLVENTISATRPSSVRRCGALGCGDSG